jgi:hypothetical protein
VSAWKADTANSGESIYSFVHVTPVKYQLATAIKYQGSVTRNQQYDAQHTHND